MALGTVYKNQNGNNQQSMWEPSYYSRLRIKNPKQELALSFNFWKGTLKIIISEFTNNYDNKNNELAYIHLSPTKAFIMSDAVNRIIHDEKDNVYGVDTGIGDVHGFIAIGRDKGIPYLFIAKVNSKGVYESSQRFDFTVDYNYLLDVKDITNLKCQKEFMNNVELLQFYNLLVDYSKSASGALGASFYDIGRYESAKTTNLIKKIANKLGTDTSNNASSNNYFNNVSSNTENDTTTQMSTTNSGHYDSIDDLESVLG